MTLTVELKQNRKPKLFVSFDAVKKGSTFTPTRLQKY
jgi:hypothetical protein